MNINFQRTGNSLLGSSLFSNRGLKSTEEKMKRQETRDKQINFYENQKANLKNMKCDTIEEIAKKLEMFHSYEDSIAAAKAVYNSEQMWHIMDEAREKAEKIAEAVEKMEPKTPEERLEEIVEEAMGIEDGGMLDEVLEEAAQMQEELQEQPIESAQLLETEQSAQDEDQAAMEKIFVEEQLELSGKEDTKYLYTPVDIRL